MSKLNYAQEMLGDDGRVKRSLAEKAKQWLREEEEGGRLSASELAALNAVRGGQLGGRVHIGEGFGVYSFEGGSHRLREHVARRLRDMLDDYHGSSSWQKAAEQQPVHEFANAKRTRELENLHRQYTDSNGRIKADFIHETLTMGHVKLTKKRKPTREEKTHGWGK